MVGFEPQTGQEILAGLPSLTHARPYVQLASEDYVKPLRCPLRRKGELTIAFPSG
jgi:hypothetical protein